LYTRTHSHFSRRNNSSGQTPEGKILHRLLSRKDGDKKHKTNKGIDYISVGNIADVYFLLLGLGIYAMHCTLYIKRFACPTEI